MTLSIIIVNYNGAGVLPDCLRSLRHVRPDKNDEVILVDNASGDNSVSMVHEQFPWVTVIEAGANLGFARGCNIGLHSSRGEAILFLNADTRFHDDALSPLVSLLESDPSAGLVGPRMVHPDGSFQLSCGPLPTAMREMRDKLVYALAARKVFGIRSALERKYREKQTVGWLTGACLLGRREALNQVGGFDENIFMYFEDKDLCKRVAGAGWGVIYLPEVSVVHLLGKGSEGAGNRRLRALYRTSQRYYYQKHLGVFDQFTLRLYLAGRSVFQRG